MTWREAKAKLGTRASVKLDRNTYLERRGDKAIAVRLHATDIVTITPTYTELDSGGWHTMTTAARMRDYMPCDMYAMRGGWQLVMVNPDMPCYCAEDRSTDGIAVENNGENKTKQAGTRLRFTERWTGEPYADGSKPIYAWQTCETCQGSGVYARPDRDRQHPYYDGIRVHPSGTRLMASQPHRPESWQPVVTESGWTGLRRGASARRR